MSEKQIEFVIPKGYKKSDKSTDEKLVFELVEKDVEKRKRDFLFDIFNKMKIRVEPYKPGHIYYDVDGMGTVFKQDFENNYLYVSYSHIWSVFETHFSMEFFEVQSFIGNMVGETLNWRGLTPSCHYTNTV